MKHILLGLYFCTMMATGALAADRPKVEECFKVNRLLKIDSTFYWADWTNVCPYTVETVYVMVSFVDHSGKELGAGVWPM